MSPPEDTAGNMTPAIQRRGATVKHQRGVFNRYLRALEGKSTSRARKKLEAIKAELARGTRRKAAPVFKDGKRVGTTHKQLPLLPSERAILLARKAQIEESLRGAASEKLRDEFLAILPAYAERYGLTRAILLEVGVPPEDLEAVGL